MQQHNKERNDIKLEQWEEQGVWLLLLVLPLGALFFRKGFLCVALLLLLPYPKNSYAFEWQDLWQRPDQQALQAYQQKDYAKAAEQFDNPDWKAAAHYQGGDYDKALKTYQSQENQTANNLYNQGNALAQSGQLKEALTAYQKALAINPDDADAQFNADLVKKELEKQQQPPPEKQPHQKDPKQDKQEKSEQQKKSDQDQKGDKSQQAEQKQPEKSESEQQSEQQEQQTEQKQEKGQEQLEQQEEIKKQVEQKQAEQSEQKKENKKTPAQENKPVPAPAKDEKQQANEQWLNRIPDDPAGLLRRKFKYQYNRNQ